MIRPLGDKVVVKVSDPVEKTAGGIFIPTKQVSQQGKIVAVGPGRIVETGELIPLEVSIGDHIIFKKSVGTVVESDGENYLVIHENDIICVL